MILHFLVLLIVGLFALAGVWQLQRLSERRAHNVFVREQQERSTAPIGDLRDAPAQRRVRASGRYDTGREVILRGRASRPNGGRPGNHVLTPLVMNGGRAVIVDRGWVPFELDSPPVAGARPPDGQVEVTGVLLPSEGSGPLTGGTRDETRPRELARIDVARISRWLPDETHPLYLVLQRQEPAQRGELPIPVGLPSLDEGPHLIYAVQWFLFIPIALGGYSAILRREARKRSKASR